MSFRHPLDPGYDDEPEFSPLPTLGAIGDKAESAQNKEGSDAPGVNEKRSDKNPEDETREITAANTVSVAGIKVLDLSDLVSRAKTSSLSLGDRLSQVMSKSGIMPAQITNELNNNIPGMPRTALDTAQVQMITAEAVLDESSPIEGAKGGQTLSTEPNTTEIRLPSEGVDKGAQSTAAATIALSRDLLQLGMSYLRRETSGNEIVELDLTGVFDRYPEIAEDPAFHDFVDLTRKPGGAALVRNINDFVYELQIQPRGPLAGLKASQRVQRAMEAWESDPNFAADDDRATSTALEGLESYLFSKLKPYQATQTTEDRQRDEALHFRISLLNAAGLSLRDLGMSEKHTDAVQKMVKYGGFGGFLPLSYMLYGPLTASNPELLKIDTIGTPRLRMKAIVNFHKAAIGGSNKSDTSSMDSDEPPELISAFLAEGEAPTPSPTASKAFAEHLPIGGDVVLPALIWVILRLV